MTPTYDELKNEVLVQSQPTKTYRIINNVVHGKINDLDAVIQAVKHILSTERYSNPIYDDDYGVELEQYKGKSIDEVIASIEYTIKDALTQDDRIRNAKVLSIKKISIDSCSIEVLVSTIYGDFSEVINV